MKRYPALKRIFDLFLSIIGIIILTPLYFLISIAIKISSKGSIIYIHPRIGKNKKKFNIYKFRTMVTDARQKQKKGIPDSELITNVGKVLRRCFLDETPQLLNILKGDLSFIGPRPIDREIFKDLVKKDKRWNTILNIKPGLTSIESVADYMSKKERKRFEKHFKGLLKKDKAKNFYKHRFILDKYYVENESLLLDIDIFISTIRLTISRILKRG